MKQHPRNDPTQGPDSLAKVVRRNLSFGRLGLLWRRGVNTVKTRGWQGLWREIWFRLCLLTGAQYWQYRADLPTRKELAHQRGAVFGRMPLVSVVVPLYRTRPKFLRQMLDSVRCQSYPNWELVLVDGSGAGQGDTARLVEKWAGKDQRVRLHRLYKNQGIALNTNIGLAECEGEYIALLDHDDLLTPCALYEVVRAINETGADLLYTDETVLKERLDKLWRYHVKPDFSPDTLRGCNYITHLLVFRKDLLAAAGGGERQEFDGAQDYDLVLRLTEQAQKIVHIPKLLYWWRQHDASTASDISAKPKAVDAGAAAIQKQLDRLGLDGVVEPQAEFPGSYRVHYQVADDPMVSVVIPSKDHAEDLRRALDSLYAKAGWRNFEVLVVENNSAQRETFDFYAKAKETYPNLRLLRYEGPFNFAAICNQGAAAARGGHLLFLNNDVQPTENGFLAELLSYSQRPDVGAVGPALYYPDGTVQHAGLFVGLCGSAGVSHKGHKKGEGGQMFRLCTTQNMSAVTGAALMVKRALYENMGGMDAEHFAVAFNDVDLCLRLREAGYLNIFTPFAQAIHHESKTRGLDEEGEARARFEREKAALRRRHALIFEQGDPYYNPHLTLQAENYAYK